MKVNGFIGLLAVMQYVVFLHQHWYSLFAFLTFRNFCMIYVSDHDRSKTRRVSERYIEPTGFFEPYVIQAAAIETITSSMLPVLQQTYIPTTILYFIPISFAFEICFDFLHYWIHRAMHSVRNSWHKTHHEHIHLKPSVSFYQDIFDVTVAVAIPSMIVERMLCMVFPISLLDISLLMTYKVYIEIAGHIAYSSGNTCSFPQCIWLPKALGIELYSDDHALHHSDSGYNYSKRFTLWDKVFGTYRSGRNTRDAKMLH